MRRPSLPALAVVATIALGACTGGEEPSPGQAPAATSPPPTFSSEGYLYTSDTGIRALASFRGGRGTLEVENGTGGELGEPGLYLLDARTGGVVDAQVRPARPVGDGETRTFRVALARPVEPGGVGLVVLTIGGDDLGAFLPPAAAEAAT